MNSFVLFQQLNSNFSSSNIISSETQIIQGSLVSDIGSEFWESSKTLKILAENNYFEDSSSTNTESKEQVRCTSFSEPLKSEVLSHRKLVHYTTVEKILIDVLFSIYREL